MKRVRLSAFFVGMTVVVGLLLSAPADAETVQIFDASKVLDVTKVQNKASTLPRPVTIFTTAKSATDNDAFDAQAQTKVTSPKIVVIAINTESKHLAIRGGAKSLVNTAAMQAASNAFSNSFRSNSDYTAATLATLDSLKTAMQKETKKATKAGKEPSSSSFGLGSLLCCGIVVLGIGGIIFAIARSKRRNQGGWGRGDRGYGQGPVGYGDGGVGYGQGGQRSGMNPWVVGGLGAAGGALLGYGASELMNNDDNGGEAQADGPSDDSDYGGSFDSDFGGGDDTF
ncbi:MAG: hypothetical protein ACRDQZ_22420 [Mycobacteriales bacterium]